MARATDGPISPRRCWVRPTNGDRHRAPIPLSRGHSRRCCPSCGPRAPRAPPAGGIEQHVERSARPWRRGARAESPRCSCCSATIRRVFSSSATSSAYRLEASVFGRSEYLNENMLWYRTRAVSDSVSSKSAAVSPGKPTIMSVLSAMPGTVGAHAVDEIQVRVARVAAAHHCSGPGTSPTGPADGGACRPSAGPRWRASSRSVT